MNKKKDKLNCIYKLLAKILGIGRNFFSFFMGMIVCGYVVEISVNTDNNILHWGVVCIGLIIGIISAILLGYCEKIEKQKYIGNNNDNLEALKNEENINPNIIYFSWACIFLLIVSFFTGICVLKKANHKQQKQFIYEKIYLDSIMIKKIDSAFQNHTKMYESIQENRFQELKEIDSLKFYRLENETKTMNENIYEIKKLLKKKKENISK
jgi:hypothetical protein